MEKKDIIQSFKDSLFTGFIALALFGPIVGLRTASKGCLLYTSPSPRDGQISRMPSSA